MPINKPSLYELEKLSRRKTISGYPIATVSYYGPTDKLASKVAVGIVEKSGEVIAMERWFSENEDVRKSEEITSKIIQFLKLHNISKVAMPDHIIGCPHEEGIDYPEGSVCPKCPYWANKDRWSDVSLTN